VIEYKYIQVKDAIKDWKEAIRIGAKPLLEDNIISDNYIEQMINNVIKMGPYIVIAENIAIPHARPEDGAYKSAISILKLRDKVKFGEERQVNTIIVLASANDEKHIETLKKISNVLSDKTNYNKLINTESVAEIYNIWNHKD
jgi:mannitol/fructose-specific phosphotransferase system IIA component (Ntr-type)